MLIRNRTRSLMLAAAIISAGCAAPAVAPSAGARSVSVPLQQAWFEGRLVEYISTDASDEGMARMMGINHVPQLAAAAAPAGSPPGTRNAVDNVYKFSKDEQIAVFASAPQPAGADNASRAYTPLWAVVMVEWAAGQQPRALVSEEAVLAAAEKGEVRLTRTRIVINCPIVRSADGRALTGLR
jgi:hypothetical protein